MLKDNLRKIAVASLAASTLFASPVMAQDSLSFEADQQTFDISAENGYRQKTMEEMTQAENREIEHGESISAAIRVNLGDHNASIQEITENGEKEICLSITGSDGITELYATKNGNGCWYKDCGDPEKNMETVENAYTWVVEHFDAIQANCGPVLNAIGEDPELYMTQMIGIGQPSHELAAAYGDLTPQLTMNDNVLSLQDSIGRNHIDIIFDEKGGHGVEIHGNPEEIQEFAANALEPQRYMDTLRVLNEFPDGVVKCMDSILNRCAEGEQDFNAIVTDAMQYMQDVPDVTHVDRTTDDIEH